MAKRLIEFRISIHALLAESDKTSIAGRITSKDFYPRSPCGERRGRHISKTRSEHFYPRSPCGERLIDKSCQFNGNNGFLSTLSLRRATSGVESCSNCPSNFYPRSPCGERHLRMLDGSKSSIISIHALLAESDSMGH